MKLYATVTSERASKGQGGKYLDIRISDATQKELADVQVTEEDGEICLVLRVNHENKGVFWLKETKGNKQKGEICDYCGTSKGSTKPCDSNNPALKHSYE